MRDNHWLEIQLDNLFKTYFADVPITNPIVIKFGREAKYRFGSIKLLRSKGLGRFGNFGGLRKSEPEKSIITITSLFKNEIVPSDVVSYTIAHELTHYAHGFSSVNKRLFKHPHHGGIVNKELTQRGAENLISAFKKWLKNYRVLILSGKTTI